MNDSRPTNTVAVPSAQRQAEQRERLATEICYRGFAYNVRSQGGIDSLRAAIKESGHG